MDVIYLEALLIGIILSADSFSAAIAMGAREHKTGDALKFACLSGGAEAFVSFLGAIAGAKVISQFDYIDHWISFFLLLGVAFHMAYEGIQEMKGQNEQEEDRKFHSLWKVIIVSFATSLDAFAVGVSLGVSNKALTPYVFAIGLCALLSTLLGMSIAKRASQKLGPIFALIASFVLLILGVKFLYDGLI